jgi:hypothetical protein
MMAKVIKSKRGNKTLVLNNFKCFIGLVNKYQLIIYIYIVTIYINKVTYTIICHIFHLFISNHF